MKRRTAKKQRARVARLERRTKRRRLDRVKRWTIQVILNAITERLSQHLAGRVPFRPQPEMHITIRQVQ